MNCKDCGAEVANIGALNKHRKTCPALTAQVESQVQPEPEPVPEVKTNPVIGWDRVDPTLKVLARGTPLVFKIIGVVTRDGVEVKEVHPYR